MEVVDCKERCDLLRSYFQKVNPNSIPCTYKSNFEDSAIQSLLSTEVERELSIPRLNHVGSKDFGPWKSCSAMITNKMSSKSTVDLSKKSSRVFPNLARRPSTYRSASESNGLVPRLRKYASCQTKNDKITMKGLRSDDVSKSASSGTAIPFNFRYVDDYKQYIEHYRKSYTNCKIQEANQGRQVAARLSMRAYDFRCGLKNSPAMSPAPTMSIPNPRTLTVKTVTLQMPTLDHNEWNTNKSEVKRTSKQSKSAY